MPSKKKTTRIVVIVASFALVLLWPVASNPPDLTQGDFTPADGLYKASLTEAPFGLLGVKFYESNAGKKRWMINSQFAELHRRDNYAFLKSVNADFFAERTGNRIQTKSNYGRSRLDRQQVDLEGEVSITSRRGYLFEMDRLNYYGSSHELRSADLVRMRGPSLVHPKMFLRGTGLLGNIDAEHFFLKRNVSAQRRLKSTEWLRVLSSSGEFFTEEQRAVFVGRVKATLPRVDIQSDILELMMGDDRESLFARGNVVLKQKDKIGRAESAFLEAGSSRITLEGNAHVDSKQTTMKGRRIVLYTDEDRVEVEAAEGRLSN